jgi:hypothetical protein
VGTHLDETKFPKKADESNVARIPLLGIIFSICIPNNDEPINANDAPTVLLIVVVVVVAVKG